MKQMKWNKKMLFPLILAVFLAFALSGCGGSNTTTTGSGGGATKQPTVGNSPSPSTPSAPKPEKTDIKVGLALEVPTYLPIYLADKKGFFKEEGLNVTVTNFQGDSGVVQALAGKSVDINVASMTGLVNSIKADQPFVAFWGGFNFADFTWYGPEIKSIAEAKGKRIGVTTFGSLTDSLTRYVVKKAGLQPEKDVGIVAIGGPNTAIPALESGQIHAYIFPSPFNYVAEDMGMNLMMSQRKEIVPNYPTHVVYSHKDFVKANPETINAFLRGIVKGMDYIKANPEEAAIYLVTNLKYKKEHAVKTIEVLMPDWNKDGKVDQKGLVFFWELSVENKVVDKPWEDAKWLDKSFMK